MDSDIRPEDERFEEERKQSQLELDAFRQQISPEERRAIAKEIVVERKQLMPFYRHNLNLALRLHLRLIRIRKELGSRSCQT